MPNGTKARRANKAADTHAKAVDTRPEKPHADLPLFPHRSGRWAKKINRDLYYFGRWGTSAAIRSSGSRTLRSRPPTPSDEHRLRADYLDPILYILPGHWGQGWHFETHPHVYAIEFNSDLSRAVLQFREHYGGGHALLEPKRDQWVLIEKKDTWIE